MNAVPPFTKKLCRKSLEKRKCLLSSDRTKLILERVVNATCTLIEQLTSDGRAPLKIYITKTTKDALPANRAVSLPPQIILNLVKSGLIRGG